MSFILFISQSHLGENPLHAFWLRQAKQCCGTLNFWQKLVLWSGACLFLLWVARVDVIEPASNSPGPLQWSCECAITTERKKSGLCFSCVGICV